MEPAARCQPVETKREAAAEGAGSSGRPYLADTIGLLLASEACLMRGWEELRGAHPKTPDVRQQGALFMAWTKENVAALQPHARKYGTRRESGPQALDEAPGIGRPHGGGFGLMRDLQDLWLTVNESTISIAVLIQAARALGDGDLESALRGVESRNGRQRNWLFSRIRQAAPQTLTVPSGRSGAGRHIK
jgi:hypothetical protein